MIRQSQTNLQTRHIGRSRIVADDLTAVQLPVHRRFAPRLGRIETVRIEPHVREQNSRPVQIQLPRDEAVRANRKTGPARRSRRTVVGAHPKMILRRAARHRGGNDCFPDIVIRISHDAGAGVVKRLEDDVDVAAFVLAIQFRKPIVVANQDATVNSFDSKRHKPVAGRVMAQVQSRPPAVAAGAKAFIVTVHNLAARVDDVNRVVRLMPAAQTMRRTEQDPNLILLGGSLDLMRRLDQSIPIQRSDVRNIHSRVTRQSALGKVNQVSAVFRCFRDLPQHPTAVMLDFWLDGKLTSGNTQRLHRSFFHCNSGEVSNLVLQDLLNTIIFHLIKHLPTAIAQDGYELQMVHGLFGLANAVGDGVEFAGNHVGELSVESSNDFMHNITVNVGQAEIAAGVAVGQALMIESH